MSAEGKVLTAEQVASVRRLLAIGMIDDTDIAALLDSHEALSAQRDTAAWHAGQAQQMLRERVAEMNAALAAERQRAETAEREATEAVNLLCTYRDHAMIADEGMRAADVELIDAWLAARARPEPQP